MQERFLHFLRNNCGVGSTDNILVACSGGVDSMVLVRLLLNCGQTFTVAHCNFQLRGKESDADEQLVNDWCRANKIECMTKRFDTKKVIEENGDSTQMVARDLRYNWFREIMSEKGIQFLATAHHLDDSIETFLINLSRGSGLSGLTGIKASQNGIIRPLLAFTKDEIREYASANSLRWREDASNSGDDYLRNRIRHKLVPSFEAENSGWKRGMANTLKYLDEASRTLHNYFEKLKTAASLSDGVIDIRELKDIKPLGIFLHHCYSPYGFTSSQLTDLEKSFHQSEEKSFFAGNSRLVVSRGRLSLTHSENPEPVKEIKDWQGIQSISGVTSVQLIENSIEFFSSINSTPPSITLVDLEELDFPLLAGHWIEGDRFTPFGMKGSKLVSDFFNDIKLDKIEKEKQIILRSSKNGIIWIAGKRLDDRFKVRKDTRLILKIEFEHQH